MGDAYFYHLTSSPLEVALPMLLERSLGQGWRVVVRGCSDQRMDWLDQRLWLNGDGFLPHGRSGGPHDAIQPVLLTTQEGLANAATCVMAIDGAVVTPEEASRLERVSILFDGNDPAAVDAARGQWKTLTGAGVRAKYWAEEDGRWQKKAER